MELPNKINSPTNCAFCVDALEDNLHVYSASYRFGSDLKRWQYMEKTCSGASQM